MKAVYQAREDGDWDFVAAFVDEDVDSNMSRVDSFVLDLENDGEAVKVIDGELRDFPDVLMDEEPAKDESVRVVVLNDGETYTGIAGCRIVTIPQKEWDAAIAEQEEDFLVKERYVTGTQIV